MLSLKNISKDYYIGKPKSRNYQVVHALKDVSIDFRESEFVAILGQSGCGKTTLLNIIGGLDAYTSGDLIINNVSTKDYKDKDWDAYRNHSIGFIFQSYNLIPHQSVLANVELALTLSGVSKEERKNRAIEALTQVGLEDKIYSKPNQLSGGQMQRVAIARALVNNPDIILADEPTGALDSKTSVQVMDILKSISKNKLIIMVTHNPSLAEKYATRTVKLFDGEIVSDSKPYKISDIEPKKEETEDKTHMSFTTALSLSVRNLLTKKARTGLVSFAGSIGIIGIAMILSMSTGFQNYINRVQEDTLSSYPITIASKSNDMSTLMNLYSGNKDGDHNHDYDAVYSSNVISKLMKAMSDSVKTNNLTAFKSFLETDEEAKNIIEDGNISYSYKINLQIFKDVTSTKPLSVSIMDLESYYGDEAASVLSSNNDIWSEMIDNHEIINRQYNIIKGRMPNNYDEAIVILDEHNEINDFVLYGLGFISDEEYDSIKNNENAPQVRVEYDTILNKNFYVMPNSYYYSLENDLAVDKSKDADYLQSVLSSNDTIKLKIVGIVKPNPEAVGEVLSGTIAYQSSLTREVIKRNSASPVAKKQLENQKINVFTGQPFDKEDRTYTKTDVINYFSSLVNVSKESNLDKAECGKYIYDGLARSLAQMINENETYKEYLIKYKFSKQSAYTNYEEYKTYFNSLTFDEQMELCQGEIELYMVETFKDSLDTQNDKSTYKKNLSKLSICDLKTPRKINIYATDFANKEEIIDLITRYNNTQKSQNKDTNVITYTDYVGLLMDNISSIIDIISTVLIVFVSISLVVSSIMIGVITYISVLERIKEIGVLRAIGASKSDIKRVFTAESISIGFFSGILGIVISALLIIPANIILKSLTKISSLAVLPLGGSLILICVSVVMTFIAGLIPSQIASKKDPVVALRTE